MKEYSGFPVQILTDTEYRGVLSCRANSLISIILLKVSQLTDLSVGCSGKTLVDY